MIIKNLPENIEYLGTGFATANCISLLDSVEYRVGFCNIVRTYFLLLRPILKCLLTLCPFSFCFMSGVKLS